MPITTSFEFFPPKSEAAHQSLWLAVEALAQTKPAFMTMTFGAGGSTRDGTLDLAEAIQKKTGISTAAHLTCISLTKDELSSYAKALWGKGIRHIVALRGDLPEGAGKPDYASNNYYRYANEFVTALKAEFPFEISVAAYPEKHPEAQSLETDIEALKSKCTAGAARAITQFFFDNDRFYRFLDKTAAAGLSTPVVPGLLPILNFAKAVSFAQKCGASIPPWLQERFAGKNEKDVEKIAGEILIRQVEDLANHGVSHFHFYTLNKAELCLQACRALKKA
jgi:methylenetetrahydrofolate reductase (NADPH)